MMMTALNQAFDNIRENPSVMISGVITTSFSLIVLGTFILIYQNLTTMSRVVFGNSQYSIFLVDDVSETDKKAILAQLDTIWKIADVEVISSAQAKQELLDSFGEAQTLFQNIELSKLPEIIEFSLQRPKPLTEPEITKLRALKGVRELVFGRDTQAQVAVFFTITEFVGVFLISLLLVSVGFIIRSTIQIATWIRIKEIEVMSILGATKRFVQFPYILEGIIITAVSSVLASGILYFLYQFVLAGITFNPSTYAIRELATFFSVEELGIVFATIVVIGIVSSALATDKVLKQLSSFERFKHK